MTDYFLEVHKVLSPPAAAVLDTYWETFSDPLEGTIDLEAAIHQPLAAALRALVLKCEYCDDYGTSFIDPKDILAIATELEGKR